MNQTTINQAGAESVYFARPYSLCATGFYFTTLADYHVKADACRDDYGQPVEEFELQYIDGDAHQLFNALSVNQATLSAWFELIDALDPTEDRYLVACNLADEGCTIGELADRWDDFTIYHGTAEDYARDMIEYCEDLPERIAYYVDYQMMGRDMVIGGDITELTRDTLLIGY